MIHRLAVAFLLLGSALLLLSAPAPTWGCATVMSKGAQVAVATETALIVWDEKAKRQHFIRRASFATKVPYFGFLVPTPAQPDLAEAPDELFRLLEECTKPEVRRERVYRAIPLLPNFQLSAGLDGAPAGAVQILDRGRVSGLDYTVIKATDAEKLRDWLGEHGYDDRPSLKVWLEPYVKAGWIVTAFQIAKKDKESDYPSTQAVRMSFAAERPFFPYSEPAEAGEAGKLQRGRFLRVFLVANQRMQGGFDDQNTSWWGKPVWADRLGDDRRRQLGKHLDEETVPLPEGAWLTVFDDPASPRPGSADVFFSPAADQSELRRPPIILYSVIYYPGPGLLIFAGAVLLVVVVAVIAWRIIRRRRQLAGRGLTPLHPSDGSGS
jgi:hypothetical protein